VGKLFDLPEGRLLLLQAGALQGVAADRGATDPLIYRFYELVNVYGSTFKALIHESSATAS